MHKLFKLVTLLASLIAANSFAEDKMKDNGHAVAVLAGGCFWCMEPPFDKLDGVMSTTSGYTGGEIKNPTYEQVSSGSTKHIEAIKIVYDPKKLTFSDILDVFWRNIDPYNSKGQFCDFGYQYTSAIFYHNDEEKRIAEESKAKIQGDSSLNGIPVATNIFPAKTFYPAEDYHQDYYTKNPLRYQTYRYLCGRDQRLEDIWGEK